MTKSSLLALLALVLTACPGPQPQLGAAPQQLTFHLCPAPEGTAPAGDQTLSLENAGRQKAQLSTEIKGPDAAAFTLAEGAPTTLEAKGSANLTVHFAPTHPGPSTATLVLEDGDRRTAPLEIPLVGALSELPHQPQLVVSLPRVGARAQLDACYAGSACLLQFDDTFYEQASSLDIRVENKGCPALEITALSLDSANGAAGNLAFFLDRPAPLPTQQTPLALDSFDETAETSLTVRFAPDKDSANADTQRYAVLRLTTNDPANPSFTLQLLGNAAEPSLYATPTLCDFSDPADSCGQSPRVENEARFLVWNSGSAPVHLDSLHFAADGGRFTVAQSPVGQTLSPGSSLPLVVHHQAGTLFQTEALTLAGSAGGVSAGTSVLTLSGGVKPCLTTDPADQLDFQDPQGELSTRTLSVKNEVGCGDLIVFQASVDSNPFFALGAPVMAPGEVIPPGESRLLNLEYRRPPSGGAQASVLRLLTNDPNYSGGKVVRLYSSSPVDQLPLPALQACLPTDASCQGPLANPITVHLSALNPKQLVLSGATSTDPGNTAATPISGYRFQMFAPPHAPGASLQNNGLKTVSSKATLTLDPAASGVYRVLLTVWDDRNQQSASGAELRISVLP